MKHSKMASKCFLPVWCRSPLLWESRCSWKVTSVICLSSGCLCVSKSTPMSVLKCLPWRGQVTRIVAFSHGAVCLVSPVTETLVGSAGRTGSLGAQHGPVEHNIPLPGGTPCYRLLYISPHLAGENIYEKSNGSPTPEDGLSLIQPLGIPHSGALRN